MTDDYKAGFAAGLEAAAQKVDASAQKQAQWELQAKIDSDRHECWRTKRFLEEAATAIRALNPADAPKLATMEQVARIVQLAMADYRNDKNTPLAAIITRVMGKGTP